MPAINSTPENSPYPTALPLAPERSLNRDRSVLERSWTPPVLEGREGELARLHSAVLPKLSAGSGVAVSIAGPRVSGTSAVAAHRKRYIIFHNGWYIMTSSKRVTSITLRADVLHRLQDLKTANQTWDDFLTELARDYVPRAWVEELERRAREPVEHDVPGDQVIRRSRARRSVRAAV